MTVSREQIIWCYRVFLGREPESEESIATHQSVSSLKELRARFVGSAEFIRNWPKLASPHDSNAPDHPLPLDLPSIDVEVAGNTLEVAECIAKIRKTWVQLGTEKAHFSVVPENEYLPETLDATIEQFWQSGENECKRIERIFSRLRLPLTRNMTCVDYGCGVGRVTIPLATRFRKVLGYDISPTHLSHAKERARIVQASNVAFHTCSDFFVDQPERCDFYYSAGVYQHNPPVIIAQLLRNALAALSPAGTAIIQVPTYCVGYNFHLREWLAADYRADTQMHCLPQAAIFEIARDGKCEIVEVREDNTMNSRARLISNTIILRKNH
jgi:SAM-dependent methyltransferase